ARPHVLSAARPGGPSANQSEFFPGAGQGHGVRPGDVRSAQRFRSSAVNYTSGRGELRDESLVRRRLLFRPLEAVLRPGPAHSSTTYAADEAYQQSSAHKPSAWSTNGCRIGKPRGAHPSPQAVRHKETPGAPQCGSRARASAQWSTTIRPV